MADAAGTTVQRPSPWRDVLDAGTGGNIGTGEPVVIVPRGGVSAVSVMARSGATVPTVDGLSMPTMGHWSANNDVRISSDGPNQWRVTAHDKPEGELYREIKSALGTSASVIDQSHGWVNVEISGPAAPDVLAKGSSVDFHLDQFGAGNCAATQIHHMMVHITCLDEAGPRYAFQLFRSMAGSFAQWLTDSSAEFGYRIE